MAHLPELICAVMNEGYDIATGSRHMQEALQEEIRKEISRAECITVWYA